MPSVSFICPRFFIQRLFLGDLALKTMNTDHGGGVSGEGWQWPAEREDEEETRKERLHEARK